jgi:hypothetical protein
MPLRELARVPRLLDFDSWLLEEIGQARARIAELGRRYPAASKRELAQRLIDDKKQVAQTGGAVAGLLGLAAIPADLALVAYLQLSLVVEIAVLHGVNLKGPSGREQLLDVMGVARGDLAAAVRAVPLVASRLSKAAMKRLGWRTVGRVVPVVAAPVSAWLNSRDIQRMGAAALRRFDTFTRARSVRTDPSRDPT